MTPDLAEAHRAALQNTQGIVDAITVDQLHLPTPCEDWDVEVLIHHLVYGNWWVAPLVKGETIEQVGDRFEGDILGGNFSNAHAESGASATSAFLAPGAMEIPCAVSYGPVPGSIYCGHRLIDVLVHGWDLAMATSGDTRLPPDLVQICIKVAVPQIDMLSGTGAFGTVTDPGEAVDPQTRLLALLGRTGQSLRPIRPSNTVLLMSPCSTSPRPRCSTPRGASARQAERIRWLSADVLTWRPQRRHQVWHDRAVFRFLTGRQDQRRYLHTLESATAASAVFGLLRLGRTAALLGSARGRKGWQHGVHRSGEGGAV